ncbi:MAG TPA: hypothetical protein VFM82_03025 [Flavobacteriaceae bacterium]|nr:hypothetical protein [Flavobacteriaceae bacterium]
MENKNYLNDINEIRSLMNRSSRFISLSGFSAILAGIYALVGGAIAYYFLFSNGNERVFFNENNYNTASIFLISILILSIASAYLLSRKKARENHQKLWDGTAKRLLVNFLIPLISGGLLILIIFHNQHYGITASLMLIFYGLALVNAAKYAVGNIHYLGYAEIVIGLLCAIYPENGFWLWLLGFGIAHVVYGGIMVLKEKQA